MNTPVDVVVIGSGYWGRNYVRLLSHLPEANLVAVCDQSEGRLEEAAKVNPNAVLYKDLESLIKGTKFDAAIVCTNPSNHFKITRRLLQAGKHTLVEKPITTSSKDAETLSKIAAENNLKLMVGHTFIFNAGIREIKNYINSGQVGKVYYMYARRTNLGPIRDDINAVWDLAPHDISIFNYFMEDKPEWVSAVGSAFRGNGVDAGFIVLNYPNGKVANIHVSWADPHKVREVVVIGSEQRVVFNDMVSQEKVTIYKKGIPASSIPHNYVDYQFSLRDGDIVCPTITYGEPLKNQVIHFLECVCNGKEPMTSSKSGEDVIKVLEAIDKSMSKNGVPVKVG
ncbi:MAG: Gfo/Idh/MocA family oxidoreductase [Leptolinea sp.]|jgi:predicted dehydrogenase|nr:Gfo/Idh/MocA family oxidoreductase [Leptolinea sp.]